MAKYDMKNNLLVSINKAPTSISSNTTTAGTSVDTLGYEAVTFALVSATLTDGTYTPSFAESDTGSFGGEESTVAAADLVGTIAQATFAATDDNAVKTIGYIGSKRYVKPSLVSTGVTTGGSMAIYNILGHPHIAPTGQ